MEKLNSQYLYKNEAGNRLLDFSSVNYYREEKLSVKKVENGIVLPLINSEKEIPLFGIGGVIDSEGNYVEESAQTGRGDTAVRFYGSYAFAEDEVEESDRTVIYLGACPSHWGHFLIDFANRLWACGELQNYHFVYCAQKGKSITGNQRMFLEALGIAGESIHLVSHPTRYSAILIPEQAYMACDYYTKEFINTFSKVAASFSTAKKFPFDKVYFSRRHLKKALKSEIGEVSLEKNFAKNGFTVLYPEEMPLYDQVNIIHNCAYVAALSGTICHNVVFSGEQTTFIILNKTGLLNTHQVLLNQASKANILYVDVYSEPFSKYPKSYGDGPFLFQSNMLEQFFLTMGWQFLRDNCFIGMGRFIRYCWMIVRDNAVCIGRSMYRKLYYTISKYPKVLQPFKIIKKWVSK